MRPGEDAPQADHVRFLFDPGVTLRALAGQRRRFAATVAGLSADELASPSRCAGWSVADIVRHLVWADTVVRQLWSGDMSLVAGFDPRTTPDDAVRADRVVPDAEMPERYLVSTETMVAEFEDSGPERFGNPGITPIGRVPWWMSAVHLGWDSTVHERDVLAPLGRATEDVPAEALPCLAYSLVLGSFFSGGAPLEVRVGAVQLSRTADVVSTWAMGMGPDESGARDVTVLQGNRVVVIDALCGRGPLDDALSGNQEVVHRLGGLARFFASAP